MRKPNKNSTRQRLLCLEVGEQLEIARESIKVDSLSAMLYALKRDHKKGYSYATGDEVITVIRKI